MNRTQQKYLEERISRIAQTKQNSLYTTTPDPTKIATARKLVHDYDLEKMKKKDKIRAEVSQYKVQLLDALYFQDEESILLAIKSFEEKSF